MSVVMLIPPAAPPTPQATRTPLGLEPYWLPHASDFSPRIKALQRRDRSRNHRMERTGRPGRYTPRLHPDRSLVDRALQRHFGATPPPALATRPVKLAVLGSSTLGHLLPAIRVGALRRGLWVTTHEGDYGQYLQELADAGFSAARVPAGMRCCSRVRCRPSAARGASAGLEADQADALLEATLGQLRECWRQCPARRSAAR